MPKVSVILASYNHEKYIAASIESVLNQSFGDFELLIFDDGSTDNSQKIIRSFRDDRIKLFLYEKNRGSYHATQDALKSARGKYLAIHHSDDIWVKNKLERQVQVLDENPEYAVCFTQANFIDENGEIYDLPEEHPYKYVFQQRNRTRQEWLNQLFHFANCFCNPSALGRNNLKDFPMNRRLLQLPDYFMWIKLCQRKNVYVLDEKLINFRLRRAEQNSASSLSTANLIRFSNEIYFTVREYLELLRDEQEFLKIFPEAQKYLIDGQIDTKFAFAQLCLEEKFPAYRKLGLEILYDLLHNNKRATLIKKLYDYDEKNFARDTGNYDVFGVTANLQRLNCQIEAGGEFFEKLTYVRPDGNFFVRFDIFAQNKISKLNFRLNDKGALAIKFLKVLVNGEFVKDFSSSAIHVAEDFHIFLSAPTLEIPCRNSANQLQVEILGVVDQNYLQKFEVMYRQTCAKIQEQAAQIAELQDTQDKILNSKSWKTTEPLRFIGKFLRKILR